MTHTPAWLVAAADQRIALMKEKSGSLQDLAAQTGATVIMSFLSEPEENASPQQIHIWENTCDNCGKYSRRDSRGGTVERKVDGVRVILTMAACNRCWRLP